MPSSGSISAASVCIHEVCRVVDPTRALEPLRVKVAEHQAPEREKVGDDRRGREGAAVHWVAVSADAISAAVSDPAAGRPPCAAAHAALAKQHPRGVQLVDAARGVGQVREQVAFGRVIDGKRGEQRKVAVGEHAKEDKHDNKEELQVDKGLHERADEGRKPRVDDAE